MRLVITTGQARTIPAATVADMRQVLADEGWSTSEPEWLSPGTAASVAISAAAGGSSGAAAAIAARAARHDVDANLLPAGFGKARLFLADMDSTMIEQECIDELADLVGLKPQVSEITERAMRGEIAFEPALRERVALLKGLPVSVVDTLLKERITLMPGGRELLATMRAHGTYTCLVSGGFTVFTGRIAAILGFHEHRANELVVEEGILTGTVREPILGREAKLAALVELRERLALSAHETMAVGDGANDLAMLGEAGLGVAYRAKPSVAAAAHARIDHGDLGALLFLQGYRANEIVAA